MIGTDIDFSRTSLHRIRFYDAFHQVITKTAKIKKTCRKPSNQETLDIDFVLSTHILGPIWSLIEDKKTYFISVIFDRNDTPII